MRVITEPLHSRRLTGRRMYALAGRFHRDLSRAYIRRNRRPVPLTALSLEDFYELVRKTPYRRDDKPIEVIARPGMLLQGASRGLDCKKKAVLLGAFLNSQGLRPLKDWRFVAVSTKPDGDIHHVFPQVKMSGQWRNADATYRYMRLFQPKQVTALEVLKP